MSLPSPKLRIGLFGAAPDTDNKGVSALFYSIVDGLSDRLPGAKFSVFDNGLGKRRITHQLTDTKFLDVDQIGARPGMRYYRNENLAMISLASGLKSIGAYLNSVVREIDSCDVVLDISGGDSFSDIYGVRRFMSTVRPKTSTLKRGIPLILLPQTYGPYYDPKLRETAVMAVKGANMAWARDLHSFEILKDMLGDRFNEEDHKCGVDFAFALRRKSAEDLLSDDLKRVMSRDGLNGPVVGLNVNGLVYNDPEAALTQYSFKADYREVIHKACQWLMESTDATLVLVPHVMSATASIESDPRASQIVFDRFSDKYGDRILISPTTLDQSHLKWLISQFDWFCGTRMHSTIASLSSGVPTAAIAYSDKTRGVFDTCNQGEQVFDPRILDTDEIVGKLTASFEHRVEIGESLKTSLPEIDKKLDYQISAITDRIATLVEG